MVPTIVAPGPSDPSRTAKGENAKQRQMYRKLLGEHDAYAFLLGTKQQDAVSMVARVCKEVDQIHDVTDALLIGLAGDLLPSKKPEVRAKQQSTKKQTKLKEN